MPMLANKAFMFRGRGEAGTELGAFHAALTQAGVDGLNYLEVTSVLAARCRLVPVEEGKRRLSPSQIVPAVLSWAKGERMSAQYVLCAGVAIAMPASSERSDIYGVIAHHEGHGVSEGEHQEELLRILADLKRGEWAYRRPDKILVQVADVVPVEDYRRESRRHVAAIAGVVFIE